MTNTIYSFRSLTVLALLTATALVAGCGSDGVTKTTTTEQSMTRTPPPVTSTTTTTSEQTGP